MQHLGQAVAAVEGMPSSSVQDLFRSFVARWRSFARIAGVIEESHILTDRACSAGQLRSIGDDSSYPIFQDLGSSSAVCHLDAAGAVSACESVRQDIAAGCDLVLLSKFGKLEAGGNGLAPAFIAAIEAGIPVLTSVSPAFQAAWAKFARRFVALPADVDKIDNWWRLASARTTANASTPDPRLS